MRVSPCALLAQDDRQALDWAARSAAVSHNHPNAMHGAMAITHAIRLAYRGADQEALRERMTQQWGYDPSLSVDELRKDFFFDVSCGGTVQAALICVLEARDFESAIRNAVSLGVDCDTTAAIAGPIAEALFGIPNNIKALFEPLIPSEMQVILDKMYRDHVAVSLLEGDQISPEIHDVFYREDNRLLLTGGWHVLKHVRTPELEEQKPEYKNIGLSEKSIREAMRHGEPSWLERLARLVRTKS